MRKCAICEKGSVMQGKRKLLRGHYNLTKTKRTYPNLQWVSLPGKSRVKACANCIKTLTKTKTRLKKTPA